MTKFSNFCKRIMREKRGNVFIMTGFAIIPLVAATGVGIDYTRAARIDTKLSAAADAAALAAISKPMMEKSDTEAAAYARKIFEQQAAQIPDFTYNAADLVITVGPISGGASNSGSLVVDDRKVSISFSGQSRNMFGSIMGLSTLQVGGTVESKASRAPNIDFYLVLDTSPSMALPTTNAGITALTNLVGCTFACHTSGARDHGVNVRDTTGGNGTNINKTMNVDLGDGKTQITADGTYVKGSDVFLANGEYADSYWLAKNKGILLRVDAERHAAADLMTYAKQVSVETGAAYRAALYTFDYAENFKPIATLSSDLDAVKASASAIELLKVTGNGCGTPAPASNPGLCSHYRTTSYTGALTGANAVIGDPGTGGKLGEPKKVMFIVTDGVSDEEIDAPASGSKPAEYIWRAQTEMHWSNVARCNAIKARGIRIAILYTEYTPESIVNNGTQGDEVTKRLVGPTFYVRRALEQCASPDLMYTVKVDDDITTALVALFNKVRSTAHLSK